MIGAEKFRHCNKIGRFAGVDQCEVATIVGMSKDCEARWLAADEMPWRAGQEGPISMVGVVELLVKFELSKIGWRPYKNRSTVGKAIAPIFYNAFCYADNSLEVTGMPDDVDRFRDQFSKSTALADELTGGPHQFSYLYRCHDDHELDLADDIATVINCAERPKISYLNFRDLADGLCSRFRRPLLSVELVNKFPPSRNTGRWLSTARKDHLKQKWNLR